ncbi:hypothetical protein Ancab_017495 [Ancistrocladus abbreviatus]
MGTLDSNSTSIFLLRNLITPIFFSADKSLRNLSQKSKTLQLLRWILVSVVLFVLRILTFFPAQFFSLSSEDYSIEPQDHVHNDKLSTVSKAGGGIGGGGDSAIARALTQLLSILNDIPVSSWKYEVVRSLAKKIIDENLKEESEVLREVNCSALMGAFSRTLSQLEAAVVEQERVNPMGGGAGGALGGGGLGIGAVDYLLSWVVRAVWYLGDATWSKVGRLREEGEDKGQRRRARCSAEKLSAELLWMAEQLAACGGVEDAVERWAYSSNLAWLALSAEPRLQGSLVKVSAFLIKQVKEIGRDCEDAEEIERERQRRMKTKMLMSWLPLLCRASNGTDAPILSSSEKAELERVLEETIETLERQEDREKVLFLWLHHFTCFPSSDWPNLFPCYVRWCATARKLCLTQ